MLHQRLQLLLKLDHIFVWLATNVQDYVVAYIALNLLCDEAASSRIAQISYMSVEVQYHRQKFNVHLLSCAEQFALKQGCHHIELHCDLRRTHAHHFYKSQGYYSSPLFFRKNLICLENEILDAAYAFRNVNFLAIDAYTF